MAEARRKQLRQKQLETPAKPLATAATWRGTKPTVKPLTPGEAEKEQTEHYSGLRLRCVER